MSHSEQDKQHLSRREALRALTATGGAITLSILPDKWEKPVVIGSTLPAHAQTSPSLGTPPVTSNSSLTGPLGACDPGGGQAGNLYLVTCDYNDADGNIIADQARVRAIFVFSSGVTRSQEAPLSPINIRGDGFSGTITVPLCIGFGNNSSVTLTISFIDANGLESNPGQLNIPKPATTEGQEDETSPQGTIVVP